MYQIFKIEDQSLRQNWQNINPNKQTYINENQLVQWAKMNIKIDKKHDDYVNIINKFVEDTNKINLSSTSNLQFKYQEAVDFINWIHHKGIIQLKNNNNHQEQFNQTGSIKQQQSQSMPDQNQSSKQNQSQNNNSDQDDQLQEQQDETNEHFNSNDDHINDNNEIDKKYNNINNNINNKNNENEKNIKKLEYLQQKWQENIKIIFNHYCKISYATGQDPTFQLIQHKATILNINKFMIFCKDFNITQLKKNTFKEEKITKNHLFDIFKKNSEFFKQMTFIQFKNALRELSEQIYQSKQQQQEQVNNNNSNNNNNNNNNKLNKQLKYLLIYMQINTNKLFRNKMQKLNIHYITKINSEQKLNKKIIIPLNNQIKYPLNNGKSSQQIQEELQQRKQNRSFRKKLLENKCNNRSIHHKTIRQVQTEVMKDNHHQNNIMNSITEKNMKKIKILQPPIIHKKINTPSTVSQFKHEKITGYANVHRVKMGNSIQIPPSQGKGYHLKLNAIVEEARKIVGVNNDKLYQEQQQQYTNPTLRSNRNSNYELQNSSVKQKLKPKKIEKIQSNNHININELHEQEMNELLDLKSDDEDQYLKEHLYRQSNENKAISNRIKNKIQNLSYE